MLAEPLATWKPWLRLMTVTVSHAGFKVALHPGLAAPQLAWLNLSTRGRRRALECWLSHLAPV